MGVRGRLDFLDVGDKYLRIGISGGDNPER